MANEKLGTTDKPQSIYDRQTYVLQSPPTTPIVGKPSSIQSPCTG